MPSSHSDTIAAVATPPGTGAIAVLRVSGPSAIDIACRLSGAGADAFAPRRTLLRPVLDGRGGQVDEAIYCFYAAPRTFTGEDLLEISCHGGLAAVRAVFRAVLDAGARPADPGEFTRRAFVNGKMDLAQAEALNQFIRARTETQMIAAKHTMDGALSRRVRESWEELTRIAAAVEASIDFPEDVDEPDREQVAADLGRAAGQIESALKLAVRGRLLSEGVRVAIVGRPNVGKSSLLNLLANRARAIVSEIPGTTRDFLEETIEMGGLPVVAIDTAGLRDTQDPVEREGTRRAMDTLRQADVVVLVMDARECVSDADCEALESARGRVVAVWNKMDLLDGAAPAGDSAAELEGTPRVRISAMTGDGLGDLEQAVLQRLGAGAGFFEEALAASERQVMALRQALEAAGAAAETALEPLALDLSAVHMQAARARLAEITGDSVTESLLDTIFSSFCIGK